MRVQRLFIWTTCLLLVSVSGCNRVHHKAVGKHHQPLGSQHQPAGGGVDGDGNPHNDQARSVLIDEGGTVSPNGELAIKRPKGASKNTEFDIISTLASDGSPASICLGMPSTITTKLDFKCSVVNQDGDYIITVKEHGTNDKNGAGASIPPFTAYVRSCKGC